jgi:hypothetical protein
MKKTQTILLTSLLAYATACGDQAGFKVITGEEGGGGSSSSAGGPRGSDGGPDSDDQTIRNTLSQDDIKDRIGDEDRGKIKFEDGLDPSEIEILCRHGDLLATTNKRVNFPKPTEECKWGRDGNLNMKQLYVQARYEQSHKVDIGKNAIVCDMNFAFEEQDMFFDDEIMLLFDNTILAASMDFNKYFEQRNGLYQYNWNRLVGKEYPLGRTYQTYCLGEEDGKGSCEMPYTETRGPMSLHFDSSILHRVGAGRVQEDHAFKMVTTGDNDPRHSNGSPKDCVHSALTFDVQVQYIPLK